jgi:predicted nucleotidyltransferase
MPIAKPASSSRRSRPAAVGVAARETIRAIALGAAEIPRFLEIGSTLSPTCSFQPALQASLHSPPARLWPPLGRPRILGPMRREEAISTLRGYLPALRRDFGVRRLSLFGSTARDEAREDSDLDILVEFEVTPALDAFVGLKLFLEDKFGRKVDLVTPDALKPRMRPAVEREAVYVA